MFDEAVSILAEKEDVQNYIKEIASGTVKGDNYVGNITSITVKGQDKRGKEKVLKLVAKTAPAAEKLREELLIPRAFKVEIYMYTDVFEMFANFEKEKRIENPFDSYARCFYTSNRPPNEILVFEDLKSQGYKLWDRKTFMNPQHVSFVLKEYGKFHAISFALRDQNKELFDQLVFEDKDKLKLMFVKKWLPPLKMNFDNAMHVFDEGALEREFLETVKNKMEMYYDETFEEDEYTVVVHGDCWCNNMMFKYQDDPLDPMKMRFIDFQVSRKSNPMMDISYFFYCNASKDIYTNVEHYMKIYYKSFSKHLKALVSDPEIMYPFETFRQHWKLHAKNGLSLVIMLTRALISDQNEAPDFVKTLEEGKDVFDAFDFKIANEDLYWSRIKDLVSHMTEMGFC